MKLYELKPGDKFGFLASRPGREFEIIESNKYLMVYKEISTGQIQHAYSNRKTFSEEVYLLSGDIELRLTRDQAEKLKSFISEKVGALLFHSSEKHPYQDLLDIVTQLKNKGI